MLPNMSNLIEHECNKLNNFIAGWYDPVMFEFSDELLEYYHNSPNKKSGVTRKVNGELDYSQKSKVSTEVYLELNDPFTQQYVDILQRSVIQYIHKYPWCNKFSAWAITQSINLQHYKPSEGFLSWHTERSFNVEPSVSRHLVFMTYLNDVTDEGETAFFHQDIKIKPEKGLTVIWPADWTFVHKGITSSSQDKFIATGWYNFIKRRD
jgi:hypothetical protein